MTKIGTVKCAGGPLDGTHEVREPPDPDTLYSNAAWNLIKIAELEGYKAVGRGFIYNIDKHPSSQMYRVVITSVTTGEDGYLHVECTHQGAIQRAE